MPVIYQNAVTATSASTEGEYDRARGGLIEVKLTIPSQSYDLQGPCGGKVSSPEMRITFTIDVESLPLVNVAGYTIEEEQIAPEVLEHPGPIKVEASFG